MADVHVTCVNKPHRLSPRGLVERPEDWTWSSFRHYVSGELGAVEIESQWTARIRQRAGIFPTVRVQPPAEKPRPSGAWTDWPPSGVS